MLSVRLTVHRFAVACLLLAVFGWQNAYAGAWSDYVDAAKVIFTNDNQRLNTKVRPAERAEIKVLVEVRQTGAIKEIKVLESSGDDRLEAATVTSINAISSLPTPPASVYFRQFFTPLIFVYRFDPTAIPEARPVRRVVAPMAAAIDEEQEDTRPAGTNPDQAVVDLQTALIAAGYDPGPVDGYYGPATANAIRSYQRDNALEVDGIPSAALTTDINARSGRANLIPADTAAVMAAKDNAQEASVELEFTPPDTGKFSLNREIYEDYDYISNRHLEDYESID